MPKQESLLIHRRYAPPAPIFNLFIIFFTRAAL